MTVDQVKIATSVLESQITQLVQDFESSSGCIVHSIPVNPTTPAAPITVRVKVQV